MEPMYKSATFSIASILLGGASVTKATSGQAIIGLILFHTLFIVSPKAGNNLLEMPRLENSLELLFPMG